jgi:hypothetical protein
MMKFFRTINMLLYPVYFLVVLLAWAAANFFRYFQYSAICPFSMVHEITMGMLGGEDISRIERAALQEEK